MMKGTGFTIWLVTLFLSCYMQNGFGDVNNDTAATAATTKLGVITKTPAELEHLSQLVNEFGYKLMLAMLNNTDKNVVISPTGIAGLLAMTLLGSVGTTYEELVSVLGFSQDALENRRNHEMFGTLLQELNNGSVSEPKTNTATETNRSSAVGSGIESTKDSILQTLYADAIVVDVETHIRKIYQEYLERVYHGEVLNVKFSDSVKSLETVNNWVRSHTGGKIENFLQEPPVQNTKVLLLSALYFKGQWKMPFLKEYTQLMPFYTPKGNITTNIMLNLGDFKYTIKHGVQMIAIPYNDSSTTMYVLKPVNRHKPLLEVLQTLNYSNIDEMINSMVEEECVIRFPKIDLKSKVDLTNALKSLGINHLFTPGDANLALMVDADRKSDKGDEIVQKIYKENNQTSEIKNAVQSLRNPGLYVDSVLHDVKMTINEYGTVAVAATSGILRRTTKLFYANSPFHMFIRNEKTKMVIFSAVIFDPTETS